MGLWLLTTLTWARAQQVYAGDSNIIEIYFDLCDAEFDQKVKTNVKKNDQRKSQWNLLRNIQHIFISNDTSSCNSGVC